MPDLLSFLGEVAVRSSLVLAAVFIVLAAMRRASAAERHLVLLFGLIAVALMPVILPLSPRLVMRVVLPWAAATPVTLPSAPVTQFVPGAVPMTILSSVPAPVPTPVAWNFTFEDGLALTLAAGTLLQLLLLGRAAWAWRSLSRGAVPVHLPTEALRRAEAFAGSKGVPPIFISEKVTVPLLAGWTRATIILPAEARDWTADRVAMVLCHEIAHDRRGDLWVLPLNALLRIFYWWHPLVWLALARLRREREGACDDLVLGHNFRATDYAELIVVTARQARCGFAWQSTALAMASSSRFGDRIHAILNPAARRRPASRSLIITGSVIALALGWFFTAAEVHAEDKSDAADVTQIEVGFKLIEIDDTIYQKQKEAIEDALKKGDVAFFAHLPGTAILDSPKVTTQVGQEADIQFLKDVPFKADNGTAQKVPLGIKSKITPTLDKNGTILLKDHLEATLLNDAVPVADFSSLKENNFFKRAMNSREQISEDHPAGYWIDKPNNVSLIMFLQDGGVVPTLAKSPVDLAYIITARRADGKATPVPAPPPALATMLPGPPMEVSFTYLEIDDEAYLKQTAAINEALKKGDIDFFKNLHGVAVHNNPKVMASSGNPNKTPTKTTPNSSFSSVVVGGKPQLMTQLVISEYMGDVKTIGGETAPGTQLAVHTFVTDESDFKNGHAVGQWVDEKHLFMQFGLPKPLAKRLAFILTAQPVEAPAPAAVTTGPVRALDPKSAIDIDINLVEMDSKAYEQNAPAMNEAVSKGNLAFFQEEVNAGRMTRREAHLFLNVKQNGWYSEGEVQSYIDSVSKGMYQGKLHTMLKANAVFLGINIDFNWAKEGPGLNATCQVTSPIGFGTMPLSPDVLDSDWPSPYQVPQFGVSYHKEEDWDISDGRSRAFWVGKSYGLLQRMNRPGGLQLVNEGAAAKPKSASEYDGQISSWQSLINSNSSTRLAVFMTAQPVKN